MLQPVHVGRESLADYATLVSRSLMQELRRLAEPLQGRRVVHISATAFGGGVAEINYALVPLMSDVGRVVEWRIIHGTVEFFNATQEMQNGLQGDPDVHILSNMNNVGSVEVNAFQVHSDASLQKSLKEGFGLTVTEALWKARPTVAGRAGGTVAQITDRETGWLVDSHEECARACLEILGDPSAAREIAPRGKEHVRRSFLTPRLLHDWLVLFHRLLETGIETAEPVRIAASAPAQP